MEQKFNRAKILNTVFFAVMVIINALAEIVPFNNVKTGDVSKLYDTLITPAPYAFSIWILIYALLAAFVIYQYFVNDESRTASAIVNICPYFCLSSAANTLWIIAWHYKLTIVSVLLLAILLISIIYIVSILAGYQFNLKEKILIKYPFSIYFGWITVAALVNAASMLVSLNFGGLGMPANVWAVIMLLIGLLITLWVICKNRDVIYAAAVIWAYIGILVRHLSTKGFNGQYKAVIITAVISIAALAAVSLYKIYKKAVSDPKI